MRYALSFLVAVVALTLVAVATFTHLSESRLAGHANAFRLGADTLPPTRTAPVMPSASDYARFAAADAAWRRDSARQYTLEELRARGDGRRTDRGAMQDRVFELNGRGDHSGATAVLERWVSAHPSDREALLSLARLLNEQGRTSDAVLRYRQVLGLGGGRDGR